MKYRWSKRLCKMVPAAPRPRRPEYPIMTRQDGRNFKHLKAIQQEGEASSVSRKTYRGGASPAVGKHIGGALPGKGSANTALPRPNQ